MAGLVRKRCIHQARKSTFYTFVLWKGLRSLWRRELTAEDHKRKQAHAEGFLSFSYYIERGCDFLSAFCCIVEKNNIYWLNIGWDGKNRCMLKEQKHSLSISFIAWSSTGFCWGFHPACLFSCISLYSKKKQKCPHRKKQMWYFPPPTGLCWGFKQVFWGKQIPLPHSNGKYVPCLFPRQNEVFFLDRSKISHYRLNFLGTGDYENGFYHL